MSATASQREIAEIEHVRSPSDDERGWQSQQRAKVERRMAAYAQEWRDHGVFCDNGWCRAKLTDRMQGLIVQATEGPLFYCGRCKRTKWAEAGHRYGLYP